MIVNMNYLYNTIIFYKTILLTIKLFNEELKKLKNSYITISTTSHLKENYKDIYEYVNQYKTFRVIFYSFAYKYKNLDTRIDSMNQSFIEEENIKYREFFDNICGYPLDQNQRNAIIIDDDKNLIVAGAGSGKSLTMIGKIHYLIQCKDIKEEDILCISFTNETTKSLKDKLKKIYGYDIDVYTFHKLGYQIIKNEKGNIKIATSSLLNEIIDNYFKNLDKKELEYIFNYFSEFTKIPKEYKTKDKYQTLKAICEEIEEFVHSKEEVVIANILYLKGIVYTYGYHNIYSVFHIAQEKLYYYNFNNPQYTLDLIDKEKHSFCLYKYDLYDKGILFTLEQQLKNKKIDSFPLDNKKIYMDMLHNNNDYFISLKKLLVTFMNIYKSGTENILSLENKIKPKTIESSFFHIFKNIYTLYQNELERKNLIDINDMLLGATKLTNEKYTYKQYKYILIDEFQDTSLVRYALIHNIMKHTKAKMIAVGDDFQSIYRFSGCDVSLFINFEKYFGKSKISYIENTYRNSQELIDVAGTFVMKNKNQIHKKLYSSKQIENPIEIHYYENLSTELQKILKTLSTEKSKIILGRNNRDIELIDNDYFKVNKDSIYARESKENIPYLTVHKSKGLEYDYVFLINMIDDYTGFPSKIEEHKILKLVLPKEEEYPYAEERRLFYVALTRAKEKVFVLAPKKNPSVFVTELEGIISKTT